MVTDFFEKYACAWYPGPEILFDCNYKSSYFFFDMRYRAIPHVCNVTRRWPSLNLSLVISVHFTTIICNNDSIGIKTILECTDLDYDEKR
jgi:hypothetical protein